MTPTISKEYEVLKPEEEIDMIPYSSKSYYFDMERKRIQRRGTVDDVKAYEQAVKKIMLTEVGCTVLYSYQYGRRFEELIGKDRNYVKGDIARRISQALLYDDRTLSVDYFSIEKEGDDALEVGCTVTSIYGQERIWEEVRIK